MKQRHWASIFWPTYPFWIVDYGNKVEKDLRKDWLRLIIGTDSGDDRVHVDAKTGEVHHGMHSTNASNCSLSLGLMRVSEVHDILRWSFDLAQQLLFDTNFISLREKSRWLHWIGLDFETINLLSSKFSLKHTGHKDHWHDLNQYLTRSDAGKVLMLGQL